MLMKSRWLALLVALLPAPAAGQENTPVWAKPDLFWYYKNVSGNNVWLKVDALHGVKEPLFDHQRLAIELTIRTGTEYTPTTLPFFDPAMQFVVKYDGSNAYIQEGAMAIEFILGTNHWRCDLQIKWNWNLVPPTDYECQPRRAVVPGQTRPAGTTAPTPRVSPDGKWEAVIENHNVVVRPTGGAATNAIALSTDGSARDAYHHGSLRWSPDSKTLTAYKVNSQVLLSESLSGNVKSQIARGQWTHPFGRQ
ncbi:MAG: hypothetical protein WEE89_22720 [Gemmatimonadota bacterium]